MVGEWGAAWLLRPTRWCFAPIASPRVMGVGVFVGCWIWVVVGDWASFFRSWVLGVEGAGILGAP